VIRPTSSRAHARRAAPLELAVAFALIGSLLAIAVPVFVREVHSSRLVEPVQGLERLGASAIEYARARPAAIVPAEATFPASAPMTPAAPPRGRCEADPPGTWDHPTWTALAFSPAPEGTPHCFAFAFDSATAPGQATFRAHAHADLDGDGTFSTFEVTGRSAAGDPRGPVLDPGMFVDAENE
jgi:hypothetical protein